jgi:hypothetical protein
MNLFENEIYLFDKFFTTYQIFKNILIKCTFTLKKYL